MRDSEKGGKKHIEAVEKLRTRKAKLEWVTRGTTKKEKLQEYRRRLEDFYQAVLENTFFGFTLIDRNYEIVLVNSLMCNYFKKPAGELVGKKCFREFEKRDAICPFCPGTKAMATGQPADVEAEKVRDDGSHFSARIQAFPTLDSDGAVTGFIEMAEDITERKKMEQQLKDAFNLNQIIIDTSPVGIWIFEESGQFVMFNSSGVALSGGTAERLLKQNFRELESWKRSGLLQAAEEALLTGKLVKKEIHAVNSFNTEVWYEALLSTIRFKGEKHLLLMTYDIKDRKHSEEALRETTQTLQAVIQASPLPIFAVDRELIVKTWNPAAERTFGWSAQEVIGHKYPAIPEEKMDEADALFSHALESGLTEVETIRQRKDGSLIDVSISAAPLRDSSGNINGTMAVLTDITERKKAEETLRASEERFRLVVENAPFGYYRVGKDGLWQHVNPVWERMHGYSLKDVIGKPFEITQTREDVEKARQHVKRALAGETITGEFSRITKQGTVKYHSFNIQPVRQGNEIVAIEGFINDITERKKMEEQIKKLARFPEENSSPVYRVSKDGVLLYANPASRRLILEDRTKIGDKIPEKWIGMIRNVYDSGTRQRVEVELSGRIFLFEQVPVIEGGYVNSYAIDITERKKAEEESRQARDYTENIFNYSNVPIIFWDKELKIIRFNHAFEHLTGYTADEVIGQRLSILFPEANRDESLNKIKNTAKDEHWETVEIPILCKDGNIRLILWNSANIYAEDTKNLLATIAQGVDITERKKAENALRESEQKFRTIFDNTSDGMFLLDLEVKKFSMCNKAWLQMLGYTQEEFMNLTIEDLHLKEDLPLIYAQVEKFVKGGKGIRNDIGFKRKDGSVFFTDLSPDMVTLGGERHILVVIKDITGRKKAEYEIYNYQQRLKALTSQLSLIEERAKRKIAAELHDNVGQKLAVAKLELQSLMRSSPDTKMSDSINSICGEITRIINDVHSLTFEIGNPLLDKIGLTAALERYITEEIQAKCGIKCELNDKAGTQEMEETVRTVLYRSTRELLINSVKHAQAHNIKVRIYQSAGLPPRLPTRVGAAGNIHICVEDDGVGFEVSEIALLPTKTGGFGLFSIKEQLEYIGGNLQVESRVGHGTKITICCPPKLKPAFD